jgi:hypothetical protein
MRKAERLLFPQADGKRQRVEGLQAAAFDCRKQAAWPVPA